LEDLARLAHEHGIWLIDDIGSGALRPGCPPGVGDEPTAAAAIAAGADLVLFSGDKLLGGPQCGIIAGTSRSVGRIEADPLNRALRLDKMTLAALEATLRLASDPDRAAERIPLWSMISMPVAELASRASALAASLREELGLRAAVVTAESFIGGGSTPFMPIPTAAVGISPPFPTSHASEEALARALRQSDPPVVARVGKGLVILDLRTIPAEREPDLLDAVRKVCHDRGHAARSNRPFPE
jgi:L-seryl-tRNA(Ser) seleniumtransferase